jgi:N-succinyldiaminopimelate aminotransferase
MNKEVLVTCGAAGALFAALMNLAGPGDEVLTWDPYYPNYSSMIRLSGAAMRTVPLRK